MLVVDHICSVVTLERQGRRIAPAGLIKKANDNTFSAIQIHVLLRAAKVDVKIIEILNR